MVISKFGVTLGVVSGSRNRMFENICSVHVFAEQFGYLCHWKVLEDIVLSKFVVLLCQPLLPNMQGSMVIWHAKLTLHSSSIYPQDDDCGQLALSPVSSISDSVSSAVNTFFMWFKILNWLYTRAVGKNVLESFRIKINQLYNESTITITTEENAFASQNADFQPVDVKINSWAQH